MGNKTVEQFVRISTDCEMYTNCQCVRTNLLSLGTVGIVLGLMRMKHGLDNNMEDLPINTGKIL
jgi:hypothetical protein